MRVKYVRLGPSFDLRFLEINWSILGKTFWKKKVVPSNWGAIFTDFFYWSSFEFKYPNSPFFPPLTLPYTHQLKIIITDYLPFLLRFVNRWWGSFVIWRTTSELSANRFRFHFWRILWKCFFGTRKTKKRIPKWISSR